MHGRQVLHFQHPGADLWALCALTQPLFRRRMTLRLREARALPRVTQQKWDSNPGKGPAPWARALTCYRRGRGRQEKQLVQGHSRKDKAGLEPTCFICVSGPHAGPPVLWGSGNFPICTTRSGGCPPLPARLSIRQRRTHLSLLQRLMVCETVMHMFLVLSKGSQ